MTPKQPVRSTRCVSERGAELVEFAITLPLLALLAFGSADLGRVYFATEHLKNAAREAAYFASTHPYQQVYDPGSGKCAKPDNIYDRALQEFGSTSADLDMVVVVGSTTTSSSNGSLVCDSGVNGPGPSIKVTVIDKRFRFITPYLSNVLNSQGLQASVTVREAT